MPAGAASGLSIRVPTRGGKRCCNLIPSAFLSRAGPFSQPETLRQVHRSSALRDSWPRRLVRGSLWLRDREIGLPLRWLCSKRAGSRRHACHQQPVQDRLYLRRLDRLWLAPPTRFCHANFALLLYAPQISTHSARAGGVCFGWDHAELQKLCGYVNGSGDRGSRSGFRWERRGSSLFTGRL